eukprot:NODE_109_length_19684_cov_0.566709.p4 type:complete len:396 gc:universal NODE_109_length_19684_cov_0.566709:11375-12562(+)
MQVIPDFLELKDILALSQVSKYWHSICIEKIYRQLSIPHEDILVFDDSEQFSNKLQLLRNSLIKHGHLVVVADFNSLFIKKSKHKLMISIIKLCSNLTSLYWDHIPIEIFKSITNPKIINLSIPRSAEIDEFNRLQHLRKINIMSHCVPLSDIPFSNNLCSIYIFKGNFLDGDMTTILRLDNLKSLHLEKCSLKKIKLLPTFSKILKLSLDSCTANNDLLDWVADSCPYLQLLWLWLIDCSQLKTMKCLRWLRVYSPGHTGIFKNTCMPIERLEIMEYQFSAADFIAIKKMPLLHFVIDECTNCMYEFDNLESIAIRSSVPFPPLKVLQNCIDVRLFHMRLLTNLRDIQRFLSASRIYKLYISESLVDKGDREGVKQLGKVILCEDQLGVKMNLN